MTATKQTNDEPTNERCLACGDPHACLATINEQDRTIAALRAEVERLTAEHWVYQVGAEEWAHRDDCPCNNTGVMPTVNLADATLGANVRELVERCGVEIYRYEWRSADTGFRYVVVDKDEVIELAVADTLDAVFAKAVEAARKES